MGYGKFVDVKVDVDVSELQGKFDAIFDDKCMLEIHNLLYKMCIPYVPMDEGVLFQAADVTPENVTYYMPYAHYQYYGDVYGPNIPILQDGEVVGWFSPKGKPKHPTGAKLNYNKDKHPFASSHWDKAMMAAQGDQFEEDVKKILYVRWKEFYG